MGCKAANDIRSDCHRQVWLTYAEAAEISGLSKNYLQALAGRGTLRTRKRGAYRVHHQSLLQYLG